LFTILEINEKVDLEKKLLTFLLFSKFINPSYEKEVQANIFSLLLLMFTSRDTDSLLHTRFLGCHNDCEKAKITTTKEFVKKRRISRKNYLL